MIGLRGINTLKIRRIWLLGSNDQDRIVNQSLRNIHRFKNMFSNIFPPFGQRREHFFQSFLFFSFIVIHRQLEFSFSDIDNVFSIINSDFTKSIFIDRFIKNEYFIFTFDKVLHHRGSHDLIFVFSTQIINLFLTFFHIINILIERNKVRQISRGFESTKF